MLLYHIFKLSQIEKFTNPIANFGDKSKKIDRRKLDLNNQGLNSKNSYEKLHEQIIESFRVQEIYIEVLILIYNTNIVY